MTAAKAPGFYPGEDCDRSCLCPGYEVHARIYFPLLRIADGTEVTWADFLGIPSRELTGDLTFGTLVEEGLPTAEVRTDSGVPSPAWRSELAAALAHVHPRAPLIAGFWAEGGCLPAAGEPLSRPHRLEGTFGEDARLRFYRLSPTYLTDPLAEGEPLGGFPSMIWPEDHAWAAARRPTDYSLFISCTGQAYEALAEAGLDVARVSAEDIEELHIRKLGDIYHQRW